MNKIIESFLLLIMVSSCSGIVNERSIIEKNGLLQFIGNIERLDPRIDSILPANVKIEVLTDGFDWTEGPVWVENGNYLLFSDIPANRIYRWSDSDSTSIYLEPSGYTGNEPRGGEPGSNGLLINKEGLLVLCQHGDRRIASMDAPLEKPVAKFKTLAGSYDGLRFNSPNDAVFHSDGNLYFTDPPYGLLQRMEDPHKEIPFQGVYRKLLDGSVELMTDELSRPNGIAFSPDEKTLYISNSDPERPIWMAYDVLNNGTIEKGRVFYNASGRITEHKGLPDGLKVNSEGIIFASGPGGILVFTPEADLLGVINTGQATSNCAFDTNEEYLYITADSYLLRVKLSSKNDQV